ncbi:MAG: substrate-binding domain-containing protein [Succinivibrionaceae bacterium]|nr:substrate-binding domain-containing protein [Succinivibrionaceae bacterium]
MPPLALAALAATLALAAPAPLGAAPHAPDDCRVRAGIYYNRLSSPYLQSLHDTLGGLAEEWGVCLTTHDADGSAATQSRDLAARPAAEGALLISPVTPEQAREALRIAAGQGEQVAYFHHGAGGAPLPEYELAYEVRPDRQSAGDMAVRLLTSLLPSDKRWDANGNGRLDLIILRGSAGHPDTEARAKSFATAIEKSHFMVTVVAEAHCDWDRARAREYVSGLMEGSALEQGEAIIAQNDAMALGALDALRERGYNRRDPYRQRLIIGCDGIPEAVEAVARGWMAGTLLEDPRGTAHALLGLLGERHQDSGLRQHLGGLERQGRIITVPYVIVDRQRALWMTGRDERGRRR